MFGVFLTKKAFDWSFFFAILIVIVFIAFIVASFLDLAVRGAGSSVGVITGTNFVVPGVSDYWWLAIAALFLFIVWKFEVVLFMKDYERAVVFRFGKVNRVGGPGWALIIPGLESYKIVDLRTKTIDIAKQDVITNDSIEVRIDSLIFLTVKNDDDSVIKSVVKIKDYEKASILFVVAAIRDKVGSMVLSDLIAQIEELNLAIKDDLEKLISKWGISVEGVQIKDVQIPRTVIQAMHMQKAAVQEKLARIEKAEGEKKAIEAVQSAASGLSEKTLSYYYIRALEEMSKGKSTKLVFPLEFSRLAQSISPNSGNAKGFDLENLEQYKSLLKDYVEKAVKEAKNKDKKDLLELNEK